MRPDPSILLALFGHLLLLSLLAVGGALAIVPEMRRVLVRDMGLLTDTQFGASIAIANAAPGPNVLFIAVVGYQAAGLLGAAAMMLGMLLPSTTLAYFIARWGQAHRNWRPMRALEAGTAPIVIALVFAGAWILGTETLDWRPIALTIVTAAVAWRTRIHAVALIAAGGAAGALGLI